MDFLKSGLKTVLGAPEPGQIPSGAETVERLVDRVNNSTLLEDRRDACRALKAMSRKFRVDVGAHAMDTLKQVLELDRADNETINYALDTLNNIMFPTQFEEEEDNPHVPMNIGEQFTEMFIKDHHNVQLVLDSLDEFDFRVRLSAVQLLTSLLTNRPKDIQEIILVKPMGVSKMMDLLADPREVIRNETLLLLIKLTRGNANIQKIVAFENAFDRLFEIVAGEGHADGGIIVEDCLLLMLNLLRNNPSNIKFFKEGSYIQRTLPLLATPEGADAEPGWSPQRVSNVHCALRLVRALVAPTNPAALTAACQRLALAAGLLRALCDLLMASGVPADVLAETVLAVAEAVRGEPAAQRLLGELTAPSAPPRPAVVVLLMSMVNEKQPFSLRCAVLYCFQCYLHRNEETQAALVRTLLPAAAEATALTSGQLLCGGLFSADALSNWFAAVALLHALLEGARQREQLLRVQLATNIGSAPVSLLHQCALLLQQTTRLQPKVGLLMLLAGWTAGCGAAVAALLRAEGAVGWLVSQSGASEHDEGECLLQGLAAFLLAICVHFNDDSVENYTKDSLKQLLLKRIGIETLTAKLNEVSRHELYNRAAKHPQPRAKIPAEILIDYEFCKLFKSLEGVLVQSLTPRPEQPEQPGQPGQPGQQGQPGQAAGAQSPPPDALQQYKALIRQQDARLQELLHQLDGLVHHNRTLQAALNDSIASNSQLKDENTLLKAQAAASAPGATPGATLGADSAREQREQRGESEARALREELDKMKRDQDDLLELLADQDAKLTEYKSKLASLGHPVEDDAPPGPSLA